MPQRPRARLATKMTPARCNRTILIVEDDPGVSVTFARMLWISGYRVATAADARAGLRALADEHPAAILVDLRMPGADGIAFVRQVRELESGSPIPIAIITGDYTVDEDETQSLRRLRATLYFKPLWLEDLVQIVEQLTGPQPPS